MIISPAFKIYGFAGYIKLKNLLIKCQINFTIKLYEKLKSSPGYLQFTNDIVLLNKIYHLYRLIF